MFFFAQNRVQKIDSLLNSLYAEKKINGNFLIPEKGQIIYNKSFGFSNYETNSKLNEKSIFELASVSKQFTAMGIMILHEDGKLNINDPISKYLPELSNYSEVSIKNLLNHTSGLADYIELLDSLFDKSKTATNKDVINILRIHKPKLHFKPNTKYAYSNTGYVILASIIEKVAKESYYTFLEDKIFTPLKMENTFVYNRRNNPKKVSNYAYGYVFSDSLKICVT